MQQTTLMGPRMASEPAMYLPCPQMAFYPLSLFYPQMQHIEAIVHRHRRAHHLFVCMGVQASLSHDAGSKRGAKLAERSSKSHLQFEDGTQVLRLQGRRSVSKELHI